MQLALHGGFGEKGRTCIGVVSGGFSLLLDAGVKTSAAGGADYYPAITAEALRTYDAMLVTHGHEDHVAALGWCLARGLRAPVYMTAQTRRDSEDALAGYATAAERACVRSARIEPLQPRAPLALGPLRIELGRSGHVAGGVWCVVDDGAVRFGYCGDMVPASPVFAMDPLPRCDAVALDASYADDDVSMHARAAQVAAWVQGHARGCMLPTPLYGRSAELLVALPGPAWLAPGLREALVAQAADHDSLAAGAHAALTARLALARDWREGMPLPAAPLLCHDAMGLAGPARALLEEARNVRHPVLFTGHLPDGSPGARMVAGGEADWIRLPTHPTRSENVAVAARTGAHLVLGHSCDPSGLARLAAHVPALSVDALTGNRIEL